MFNPAAGYMSTLLHVIGFQYDCSLQLLEVRVYLTRKFDLISQLNFSMHHFYITSQSIISLIFPGFFGGLWYLNEMVCKEISFQENDSRI